MVKRNPLGLFTLLKLDETSVVPHLVEYLAHEPQCLRLLIYCVISEVDNTSKIIFVIFFFFVSIHVLDLFIFLAEANMLFRGGGIRIKIISNLIQYIGRSYKLETISNILELIDEHKSYEINPDIVESKEELEANVENVKEVVLQVIECIQTSLPKIPR